MREQRFLNLRAYVKYQGEPGILFLHGWLSRPHALPLPPGLLRLSYTFAKLNYHNENEVLSGHVTSGSSPSFSYSARLEAGCLGGFCPAGSLAELAMERYSGFFVRRACPYVFRVWHPPWNQVPLRIEQLDTSLITEKFPWFRDATFAGANLTETIPEVWMGKPHRLQRPVSPRPPSHRVLTGFYDMP